MPTTSENKWRDLGKGRVVHFDSNTHINDYYLRLYNRSLRALLQEPSGEKVVPDFAIMAALGRSACLAFQKREK